MVMNSQSLIYLIGSPTLPVYQPASMATSADPNSLPFQSLSVSDASHPASSLINMGKKSHMEVRFFLTKLFS